MHNCIIFVIESSVYLFRAALCELIFVLHGDIEMNYFIIKPKQTASIELTCWPLKITDVASKLDCFEVVGEHDI